MEFLLYSSGQCLRLSYDLLWPLLLLLSFCWFPEASYCLWFRYWTVFCSKLLSNDVNIINLSKILSHIFSSPISFDVHNGLLSSMALNVTDFSFGDDKFGRFLSNCSFMCSTAVKINKIFLITEFLVRNNAQNKQNTSRFPIIYNFRGLLLFRRGNCVPAAALDDRRLIRLLVVVRWWPRRWCHGSVCNFPPRWCRWLKLNWFKSPFNTRRLWCRFRCPNWYWRWIRFLDGCRVTRVLTSIAFGPNACGKRFKRKLVFQLRRRKWIINNENEKRHQSSSHSVSSKIK